jgi:hypothetical protein
MIADDLMMLTAVAGLALTCVHMIVGYREWRRNAQQQLQKLATRRALYDRPGIEE